MRGHGNHEDHRRWEDVAWVKPKHCFWRSLNWKTKVCCKFVVCSVLTDWNLGQIDSPWFWEDSGICFLSNSLCLWLPLRLPPQGKAHQAPASPRKTRVSSPSIWTLEDFGGLPHVRMLYKGRLNLRDLAIQGYVRSGAWLLFLQKSFDETLTPFLLINKQEDLLFLVINMTVP